METAPKQQEWVVNGVYGIWRMRVTWEPDPDPDDTPEHVEKARLMPETRFHALGHHFLDTINLHELELDMP